MSTEAPDGLIDMLDWRTGRDALKPGTSARATVHRLYRHNLRVWFVRRSATEWVVEEG